MAEQVWRLSALGDEASSAIGGRKSATEEVSSRSGLGQGNVAGGCAKKALRPAQRRVVIDAWKTQFAVSTRRACEVLQACRATYQYRTRRDPQAFLRKKIRQIAETRMRYGYRRIHILLRRDGWAINHKRVYRLYRAEGLAIRQKSPKRRVAAKVREDHQEANAPNVCWAMDFVHDQLVDSQRFKILTVIDIYSKVSPVLGVGRGFRGGDVVEALEHATRQHGTPKCIRVDNGPEFISRELDLWAYQRGVALDFSRPGKPTDNAFIEAFNSRFRQECLNQHWFLTIQEAQAMIERWRIEYNQERPHGALGDLTPMEFLQQAHGSSP